MDNIHRIRDRISIINRSLKALRTDAELESDAISHIDIDMANNAEEFAVTSGRPAEDYATWRNKARWARHYKVKNLAKFQEDIIALEEELADLHMRQYAAEAGYLGAEPTDLLCAMKHMMMDVLSLTQYQPTQQQTGLLAAVQDATKGG